MEQQIEQIVHKPSKLKKPKPSKVPKKFVNPSDQIDPDSHLGRVFGLQATGGDASQ